MKVKGEATRMRRLGAVFACLAWASPASGALDITILSSGPIAGGSPGARHVESYLSINPAEPGNLVAASMALGQDGVEVSVSMDGGRTWAPAAGSDGVPRVFPGGDPALAFDGRGTAYLVTAGKDVAVWTSTDGGRTWSSESVATGPGDRPFIRCGPPGAGSGAVYVSAKTEVTVLGQQAAPWHPEFDLATVAVSHDRGLHFDFPRLLLPAPGSDLMNVASDLLVTPEGRLILVLEMFDPKDDLSAPLLPISYSTIVSESGGGRFSGPRRIAAAHTHGHAREGKSLFGLGGAHVAMDVSPGVKRGRLYATWLDAVSGAYRVMFSVSLDGGGSWSRAIAVSDPGNQSDQSNPALAVDGRGVIGISWNDRRGDPTDRCYQLQFAASEDGGVTFSSRRVEDGFTCPIGRPGPSAAADATVSPIESTYRFKNGGDTQGIVGLPDGGFHLAWINGASGEMQLWSTAITVNKIPSVRGGGPARRTGDHTAERLP